MKKRLFVILSLLVALLPLNGQQAIVNDSKMFISQQVDSLTEAERYFNPIFLIVAEGKEYLKEQLICGSVCDCDTTIPNRRIGVFSVAPDKQVSFSQGNLQYFPAAKLWKFADNQYDYLGNANKYLSPTFRNWVDLFGWSANNTTAPFGVSTSTNVADYAGDFVDWGNNWICGDAPGTWRTLSADEWEYLFEKREKALQLRSKGSIDGHRGHILLPDDWVLPDGVHFVAEPNNLTMDLDINSYTQAEWRIMEEAGAIFLPAAGRRDGTTVGYLVEYSGLWSSTSTANTNAYHSYYNYESEVIEHHWTSATSRMNGRSVRLVHDTIVPKVEPEYVDLGLSVKWATFNVGATSPEDYGDYFAWGETQPKEEYTWENYKWCDGAYTKLNKYCTKEQYGTLDNLTTLQLTDDAAHTNWKGNWRMPSSEEAEELISRCTWTWTTINGISGHQITGPNGNSIFLPATGAITKDGLQHAGSSGYYWINSISMTTPYNANDIYNRPPNTEMDGSLPTYGINAFSRYIGRPIRPVYDDTPTSKIIWYTDEAIKGEGDKVSITNKAGFAYLHPEGKQSTELNRCYQGKRINCIRLQVAKEGSFTVSVADRDRLDSLFNPQTITLKEPSKEPQVYHLPQTIHLQKNQVLVFAQPTDDGKFYYSDYIGDITFYAQIGQKEVDISNARKTLHIDAGYYCEEGDNCDTLAIPEPEYVDLGLSVKWATFNVGATSPEDYGDYFAWGETEPKETYSWATYKWCDGTENTMTKYNATDGKTILDPEDDAAQVQWGGKWRMPTKQEMQELFEKCTWTRDTLNGINGHRVIGTNGSSVFLPAAGFYNADAGNNVNAQGRATYYWTSSANGGNGAADLIVDAGENDDRVGGNTRRLGFAIRPVYDDTPKSNTIWYSNEAIKGEGKAISITNKAGFAYLHPKGEESTELNRHYQGKRINCIRLQVAKEGTFTVSVADRDRLDSLFNPQTITLKEPSKKPQVYHLPQTIHLQKNQVLVFAQPTDEGKFYYSSYIGDITYYGRIGQKEVDISNARKTLHIDAGYYCEEGDNCDTLAIPEPEYVDLGLSVKWATFNVGATSPEDYGDYFAWGETEPKEEYSWETYKWRESGKLTKYNTTDGRTILEPADDAVTANWGDKWRMPSKEEVDELTQHCNWIWTTHNNVNGYKVTGPNGNSIFLPAAGYKGAGPTYPAGEDGLYWTNTTEKQHYSYMILLHDDAPPTHAGRQGTRCFGFTIRPVYDDIPDPYFVVKINDTLSINMVYVEGGTFTMGAMEGDTQANANEKPAHQVTLNYDYYMAQTEVTQALWKTVMGNDNNPSTIKGDNLPVNNVLWEEAQAFVEKLSQTTGQNFYLPTEAEWEYAARGGKKSKGYLYAGSNKVDEVAWYNSNSGGVTHPVAQKMPNELGIYDMSGNVWEWCSDWLAPYTAEAQLNPTGPATGECHVYHGGGWAYGQNFCRSSHRRQTVSGYVQQALGLRVVMRKK